MKCMMGILLCAFLSGGAIAQQKNLVTEIKAVTVYRDRAEIKRSGEIYLNPGDYEFVVKDLPVSLNDQSIRVSGSGTASAKITDIKIETEYIDTLPANRLKDLQEQLKLLVAEERVYSDRQALLAKEKDFLDLIKNNATNQSITKDSPRPTLDEWTRLFVFYDGNFEKINEEIRGLEKKKSDLSSRKTSLQNQINQLSGYGKLSKKKALLNVSVAKAGNMNFDLTYVIGGAKWYPVYDVRVSPEDKTVELVYYAMISQRTGEDWKNVALSISTARPNISGSMPALSAWYLNIYAPPPYYSDELSQLGDMKSKAGMGAGAPAYAKKAADRGEAAEESKEEETSMMLEAETATVQTRSTSVVFNVKKPSSIPSDNFDHKISISSESLNSEFAYSTTPKLAALAYLKGTIENVTDVPFLAGSANVFFGSNFVGTTYINTVIPTEKFSVFLGIDEAIRVKREQVKDYKSEKGLLSKSTKKTFEYKIIVESFKKTDEEIVVQDQFPISQDERIKVEPVLPEFEGKEKYTASHPNGIIEKKGNGIVEWRLKIKPKEKIELRIKYHVEYARDLQIDGL
ncbi:mucoidy inhibitor MuiA family protein [bacterium]|nr:mucoidy inhibitor MuiA family protein [bacterium]